MDRWTSDIENITAEFEEKFGTLTQDQLNWKLNSDSWSVAQNINHLIVINSTYFPILDQLENQQATIPWHSKVDFITNWTISDIL